MLDEMKIALIKATRSHCKCFRGWELNTAPIASTAGSGLQSVQEESRTASLRYKHTSAQIREGFGVSLDSSTAKTTKFSCLVIGNKGSEEFLMLAGLGLHFQERKRTLP